MKNYLFIFSNGTTLIMPAETKIKAINIVSDQFFRMVETESFEIKELTFILDKEGDVIRQN